MTNAASPRQHEAEWNCTPKNASDRERVVHATHSLCLERFIATVLRRRSGEL
jgi:hypothetical protein